MAIDDVYPRRELTDRIIGAAFEVHNALGRGLAEKVYENAFVIELQGRGLRCEHQKRVPLLFKDEAVGEFVPDLVVDDKVLVEIKAVKALTREYDTRLLQYLKATRIEIGLLINFGDSVEVHRRILTPPTSVKSV